MTFNRVYHWAFAQCRAEGRPPYDSNIMWYIRDGGDKDVAEVIEEWEKKVAATPEGTPNAE